MKPEIRAGINNRILAETRLTSSTFEFDEAITVSETGSEYAVFRTVTNPQSRDSGNRWEEYYYDIDVYADRKYNSDTLQKEIQDALEDQEANITITNHSVIRSDYLGTPVDVRHGEGWKAVMKFMIEVQRT